MIWEALSIFRIEVKPEVRRLRSIGGIFFVLWIVDLGLNIYMECLTFNVNAYVVFNIWMVLTAAALSHHYGYPCGILLNSKDKKNFYISITSRNDVSTDIQGIRQEFENPDFVCFGYKRLYVLISFGSNIFVMFGCLAVIGESLQHAFHTPETSPVLIVAVGLLHVVLFTMYSRELDMYDYISGRGVEHSGTCVFPSREVLFTSSYLGKWLINRWETSLKHTRIVRSTLRVFSPLMCIAVSLVNMYWSSSFWEVGGALLLAGYIFAVLLKRSKELAWLLANNIVSDPSTVAKSDSAIRNVRMIDGVLNVKSAVFWKVTENEIMALVRLRLMSSANPAVVTTEARKMLNGVAAYVFVEACTQGDEEKDDVAEFLEERHLLNCHSHDHGCNHHHDHHHDDHHHHGHYEHGFAEEEHQTVGNGRCNDNLLMLADNSLPTSSINMLPFSRPPAAAEAEHPEQQAGSMASVNGGNCSSFAPLKTFTFVPPPFPKPPS